MNIAYMTVSGSCQPPKRVAIESGFEHAPIPFTFLNQPDTTLPGYRTTGISDARPVPPIGPGCESIGWTGVGKHAAVPPHREACSYRRAEGRYFSAPRCASGCGREGVPPRADSPFGRKTAWPRSRFARQRCMIFDAPVKIPRRLTTHPEADSRGVLGAEEQGGSKAILAGRFNPKETA
jgi:hypothetical protein